MCKHRDRTQCIMTVTQNDTWQEQMQQLLHGEAVYTTHHRSPKSTHICGAQCSRQMGMSMLVQHTAGCKGSTGYTAQCHSTGSHHSPINKCVSVVITAGHTFGQLCRVNSKAGTLVVGATSTGRVLVLGLAASSSPSCTSCNTLTRAAVMHRRRCDA